MRPSHLAPLATRGERHRRGTPRPSGSAVTREREGLPEFRAHPSVSEAAWRRDRAAPSTGTSGTANPRVARPFWDTQALVGCARGTVVRYRLDRAAKARRSRCRRDRLARPNSPRRASRSGGPTEGLGSEASQAKRLVRVESQAGKSGRHVTRSISDRSLMRGPNCSTISGPFSTVVRARAAPPSLPGDTLCERSAQSRRFGRSRPGGADAYALATAQQARPHGSPSSACAPSRRSGAC